MVVVDKPSGWLVHPAGTDAPDLLAWLADQTDLPPDLAPVHRIDRGTSGLAVFAPPSSAAGWGERFASGSVRKSYYALVFGRTRPKGTIRRPLADARRGAPLPAVTRYRTIAELPRCSLLHVRPETGRKHQIRRHLQSIGHALVGDERYRPRGRPTVPAFPGRLWLHASALTATRPDGPDEAGESHWQAELPPELADHLRAMGHEPPSPR